MVGPPRRKRERRKTTPFAPRTSIENFNEEASSNCRLGCVVVLLLCAFAEIALALVATADAVPKKVR